MIKKLLPIAIAAAFATGTAQANSFVNGDFETGTLAGWTSGGGTWNGSPAAPVNPTNYVGGPSNNTITSAGVDPITGASTVYGGAHSVRVNDSVNNYSVSTLSQSVTNYTNSGIFFAWNAVLDGSHGLTDSDYFSLTLHDNTTNTDIVNRSYSSAGNLGGSTTGVTWTSYPDPGFHQAWLSTGWVVESIDLTTAGAGGTSVVGDDFTLTLLASDCPYGGHAGYVYLDGFGSVAPPPGNVPEPGSLALMGLGVAGLAAIRRKKSV